MENYSINYLNNSFGHEFNENFVENFHEHEHHSSKTQYEIPLQGAMFGYDQLGMSTHVGQVNLTFKNCLNEGVRERHSANILYCF